MRSSTTRARRRWRGSGSATRLWPRSTRRSSTSAPSATAKEGPYAGKPAYDDLIQGAAGVASLFAQQSGGAPRYAPVTLADRAVGLQAAIALLAAVLHAQRTGKGQAVEVPMFEALSQFVMGDHLGGHSFEPPLGPTGYARLLAPHRKPYATADGYLSVLIYNDKHWQAFFDVIGRPELRGSPMFGTHTARAANIGAVYAFVAEVMATRGSDEWMAACWKRPTFRSRACTAPTACSTTRTCALSASFPSSTTRAKAASAPSRRSVATAPRPPPFAAPRRASASRAWSCCAKPATRRSHRPHARARRHAATGAPCHERQRMNFSLNEDQRSLVAAIERLCEDFPADYWRDHDDRAVFPHEFHRAVAQSGWLGIAMPEAQGGAGLGITEAALMMRAISASGAGMSGASSVHMNIFGLNPVVVFGTEAQRQRFLPPLIAGTEKACFAVTEPDAGLDTTRLKTQAVRQPNGSYLLHGRKIWISTAQVADRMLILTRTTPLDQVKKPTQGLTLFYTPLDRSKVEVREIHKLGRAAVDSNMLFIDGLEVPEEDRIGEEGRGFEYILHGLNPERILIAAEAIGIGRAALRIASQYAQERVVFGRPIGQNQGVAHPLARAWANLEAADLMMLKAATLYDAGEPCGIEANAAKYLAAEAAHDACQNAVLTLGGMGYAKEYHVERLLRESYIPRIAPVSPQMILNFIAEKALGLPKSY
jgi:acyl-CoA dehydrogenase